MIGRALSALVAVAAGVVYAWRTERHPHTVKLRRIPLNEQPTQPFDPIVPSNGHRP